MAVVACALSSAYRRISQGDPIALNENWHSCRPISEPVVHAETQYLEVIVVDGIPFGFATDFITVPALILFEIDVESIGPLEGFRYTQLFGNGAEPCQAIVHGHVSIFGDGFKKGGVKKGAALGVIAHTGRDRKSVV